VTSAIALFRQRIEQLATLELEGSARLVAFAILLHADEDGRAFPGTATLCRLTGLCRRTVVAARRRLGQAFDVEPAMGRAATTYQFKLDGCKARTGARRAPVQDAPSTGARYDLRPVHSVHPEEPIEVPRTNIAARRVARRPSQASVSGSWSREACEDWASRFSGGTAPGGRIGKALEPLVKAHGWTEVRPRWRAYLAAADARFAGAERFAATFGDWGEAPKKASPEATSPVFVGERVFS
jgi:Helix-turn-helix domain